MFSNKLRVWGHYLLPKNHLTWLAGKLAANPQPVIKNLLISRFIKRFDVNMAEAETENHIHFNTFNDFFIRRLKPNVRSIADARVISPVDGTISQAGRIFNNQLIQAKGVDYTVDALLGEPSEQFYNNGTFATFYLSPKDYHRIHMPVTGRLIRMTYIPGQLFSVQPLTTESIPGLFTRNQRLVVFFETELGPMIIVLVGATIVGSIGTSWHGDVERSRTIRHFNYENASLTLFKGQEMGYFKLGSTTIMLFPQSAQVNWLPSITPGATVQLGQAIV